MARRKNRRCFGSKSTFTIKRRRTMQRIRQRFQALALCAPLVLAQSAHPANAQTLPREINANKQIVMLMQEKNNIHRGGAVTGVVLSSLFLPEGALLLGMGAAGFHKTDELCTTGFIFTTTSPCWTRKEARNTVIGGTLLSTASL